MRIVSLVPSWTETLIEAGANVVGRTRFCIHPKTKIRSIEAVGGTKSFDIEKIRKLKPDLIVLDREENTKEMGEAAASIAPTLVTHVESVHDMPRALGTLSQRLTNAKLQDFASRFQQILARPTLVLHNDSFSGVIKWQGESLSSLSIESPPLESIEFVYCIWKDPWMAAGRGTFISSILEQVGFDLTKMWPAGTAKYPQFNETAIPPGALVLLSSEPFPFAKHPPAFPENRVALVDGESFSWFGIRSLRFLESAHGITVPLGQR